jgi:formate--tetrahydrofolate ligase
VVTEGGFASDLGAEKFFDLVAPQFGLKPDVVVLVASVRALKSHGGVAMERITEKDPDAVRRGLSNLAKHLSNLRTVFHLPVVVALNKFATDDPEELTVVEDYCRTQGVPVALSEVVTQGGLGGRKLAEQVLALLERGENQFTPLYGKETPIEEKIALLATKVYGADGVDYTKEARRALTEIKALGYEDLPVCVAKTQMSLADDPKKKGAPKGWRLTVRDLKLAAGAGFVIVYAGNILTMPGLPKTPAAQKVDLQSDGTIVGLF